MYMYTQHMYPVAYPGLEGGGAKVVKLRNAHVSVREHFSQPRSLISQHAVGNKEKPPRASSIVALALVCTSLLQ